MKYKYAFYCSGSASRVLKFYEQYDLSDFPIAFIYYDGFCEDTINKLNQDFGRENIIIPDFVEFSSKKGKSLNEFISNELLAHLSKNNIDYLFCFGDKILKPQLIDKYENKIINFHPSILPSFPGLKAIDQALNSSVQFLGNTAHFIDNGIDTGTIILQTAIPRNNFTGYDTVLDLQIPMLLKIWLWLEEDKITVIDNKVEISTEINKQALFSV